MSGCAHLDQIARPRLTEAEKGDAVWPEVRRQLG